MGCNLGNGETAFFGAHYCTLAHISAHYRTFECTLLHIWRTFTAHLCEVKCTGDLLKVA